MAVDVQTVQVPSDDGTVLSLEQAGSGPPLLLVHDTGEDRTRWKGLYPALTSTHTVYALDRRGRGGSTDGPSYAAQREFEDLSEVMIQLPNPIDVMGLGWGAICVLGGVRRVAAGCVRRMVLYEPPLPVDAGPSKTPAIVLERMQSFLGVGARDRVVSLYLTEVLGLNGAELEEQKTQTWWRGRLGAARTIPREVRAGDEYRFDEENYRGLAVPTLLLEGSLSPDRARRAVARLASVLPARQVSSLQGQRHLALDSAPDLVLGELSRFLTP